MTIETEVTKKDWVFGSLKSKTMWFSAALLLLSTVAQYQPAWEPLLGAWGPLLGQAIAVAVAALRLVTSTPVPHK
jgi:hypothetical protein